MIVTIRRVDPQTGRDVCSTGTLRGGCIVNETARVCDPLDEALMRGVDARYAEAVPICKATKPTVTPRQKRGHVSRAAQIARLAQDSLINERGALIGWVMQEYGVTNTNARNMIHRARRKVKA